MRWEKCKYWKQYLSFYISVYSIKFCPWQTHKKNQNFSIYFTARLDNLMQSVRRQFKFYSRSLVSRRWNRFANLKEKLCTGIQMFWYISLKGFSNLFLKQIKLSEIIQVFFLCTILNYFSQKVIMFSLTFLDIFKLLIEPMSRNSQFVNLLYKTFSTGC